VTYDGTAKSAAVNGSVPGSVSSILTGGAASQTDAGTYAVTANFAPTDSTNYNSLTAASAGNFVVNKATPTASVSNSPVTYNGSAQTVAVTCLGGGIVSNITPASQTDAGTYAVTADCAASTNYAAATGLAAGNFIIDKATPTVNTWPTASAINPGQALSDSTLTGGSATVTGGFAFTTPSTTPASTAMQDVTFTPTDATNYNTVAGQVSVTVNSSSVTLNVAISGTGSGTIGSNPSGLITCPGDCDEIFTTMPTTIDLLPCPSATSDFVWGAGNDCTSFGSGTCTITMDASKNVTAVFTIKPLVKLPDNSTYATMQDAYNAASEGAVILGRDLSFSENLDFNRGLNVTFTGGNDATWAVTGYTTVNGSITVTSGSLTVSNVIVL
jgi:hypothetical protein